MFTTGTDEHGQKVELNANKAGKEPKAYVEEIVENFKKLANQMLIVPFKIVDEVHNKEYMMKYRVGFLGCDQNEKKEVFPVMGWIVSPSTQEERDSIL